MNRHDRRAALARSRKASRALAKEVKRLMEGKGDIAKVTEALRGSPIKVDVEALKASIAERNNQ